MASVLITGTNKGIGLAAALALGRVGQRVYATMRNLDRGSELKRAIAKDELPIEIHAMDVDSDTSVASAIASIRSRAGFIDVLVNNAGIESRGSIEELSMDDFKATMETNYPRASARDAQAPGRPHHQRDICGRPHRYITARSVLRFEIRPGSTQ
jgi:NAD(P)-dependent dehydrogenase (short-subunit alcohol dehydrogenase family)